MTTYRKKLIEVALPLEAINAASAKEKSIRHGHPSTLHLWWSRKPLATARAVLFASLVDDPSSRPDAFPTSDAQAEERKRLFEIIEELVLWENSKDERVLNAARAEIRRATGGNLPPVLDPFAGGGSIPLEAQRLGLEAYASDLNPVAVLINKALIEIPPRFANRPPINPDSRRGIGVDWKGAAGLAEDVRYYGAWMRAEAVKLIGHLYPPVQLPKDHGGGQGTVVAWLWARTVPCPNPACRALMPLTNKWSLSTKAGKAAWVEPLVDRETAPPTISFTVRTDSRTPPVGTVNRRGATCIACGSAVPFDHIRTEGRAGRMGAQLMAIVAEGHRGRTYLPPNDDQLVIAAQAHPTWIPTAELPHNPRDFKTPNYGLTTFGDLFTPRQLVALTTFSDLVAAAHAQVAQDATAADLPNDGVSLADGGRGAAAYGDAVATYLAFAVDKMTDPNTALCTWQIDPPRLRSTFGRQALPMVWDFAETNVFADAAGDYQRSVGSLCEVLDRLVPGAAGHAEQLDAAAAMSNISRPLISTDPPYYDNIGYADLSDFFYVWLRRSLSTVYPQLFSTLLVPKAQELIATPYRFGGSKEKAQRFFEEGLGHAFTRMRKVATSEYPLTVYYAFKQAETDDEDDLPGAGAAPVASTGWETMLEGLLHAEFQITGTWPMRTEMGSRNVGRGANALASSIVLVCRPRSAQAPLGTRREFQRALKNSLPADLAILTGGRVAPVDLPQAAIGPGMAVFSAYSKVLEPDGQRMTVRAALIAINEVIQTYFAEQEGDLDPATQFCLRWYKIYGTKSGPYGDAESMSKGANISLARLAREGLLEQGGGFVQLHPASAEVYQETWDPRGEHALTIWSATHHLVAAHRQGGNAAAAAVAAALGGVAEQARTLAYALYQVASTPNHGWTEEALGYNNLVADWPEIQRQAAALPGQMTQLGWQL